jgi:hypothetical protein
VWADGYLTTHPADGHQAIEILGKTNTATISQTVATEPSATYTLTFFHSPRPGYRSRFRS